MCRTEVNLDSAENVWPWVTSDQSARRRKLNGRAMSVLCSRQATLESTFWENGANLLKTHNFLDSDFLFKKVI